MQQHRNASGESCERISSLLPDEIRRRITDSNRQSARGRPNYLGGENRAIRSDYEFIACSCGEDCWCKRNACAGHYRLKKITFDQFLETYVSLWIDRNFRDKVKCAVREGSGFSGRWRAKNAVRALKCLREDWLGILDRVRGYDKCGLCDSTVPAAPHVSNLYEAKIWSQLFYDSIVPFDGESKGKITKAGYPRPARDFLAMNKALFRDLRKVAEAHRLKVPDIRQLDSPWLDVPQLLPQPGGQPLSRVVDKIFYNPGAAQQARDLARINRAADQLNAEAEDVLTYQVLPQ